MIDEVLDGGDAISIAAAIRDGDVTAAEVVERTIERIDERNPVVNAIVARCDDEARKAAAGPLNGPLAGVPFVIKDLGTTVAGLPATGGSRLFADVVASTDSEVVTRFRQAGLVIVGMSNVPELGRSPSTESALFGPARNPHSLSHSPGGSSGGTGAAISAGIVPAGHGTDGGGSIRIPSAACGLVGLKPSRGRVPAMPNLGMVSNPLTIGGALARSVRDAALLLDVAAGPAVGDPFVTTAPARPYLDEVGVAPGACRIALSTDLPDGSPSDPDCAAAAEAVAALLAELGHQVESGAPAFPLEAMLTSVHVFMSAGLTVDVDQRLEELGRPLADDDLELLTRVLYERGQSLTGADLIRAMQDLEQTSRTVGAFFQDHDLLVTPTLGRRVPPLGRIDTSDLASFAAEAAPIAAITSPYNVTGQPAISLPMGVDADGLPVGVQLVAAFGREDLLIRVASQLESAQPWSLAPVWPAVP